MFLDHQLRTLNQQGWFTTPQIVSSDNCDVLIHEMKTLTDFEGRIYGLRDLIKKSPAVSQLANSEAVSEALKNFDALNHIPVRAIYFDKTADKNWAVQWHQDKTIAVKKMNDVEGYGPWSVKQGVNHVQPPVEILNEMVTVRLHLDDTDESNGALKVIDGSHLAGILDDSEIQDYVKNNEAQIVSCEAGECVVMRPLLIHSSCKSELAIHRRVIHIEYAPKNCLERLDWA